MECAISACPMCENTLANTSHKPRQFEMFIMLWLVSATPENRREKIEQEEDEENNFSDVTSAR